MTSLSERIQLLNERDNKLRESRERQTDINTATAVVGTCPDMCPEYERYFREDTKQLSTFEETNGSPDPYAMVKEYRRAGADQSEPLPHELRPGPVLLRTMDYLVCNVMDRHEEPGLTGEWFDFLWSRTRAIRKDITQQHFCDETSVLLMEKCTRFHIHCAATLCEEDVSAFDPKINNENLTKCMQSLKDFYHDLWLKGVRCPNEPEFRCYDILLNLTDSDVLREIKHLRTEIRDSPQVSFAVKAFFAITGNNYMKFFKLVQSTSYLNACIMHRYFDQVRLQGLRLLRKAYTTPKQNEAFSLSHFCHHLGFDSVQQATTFCNAVDVLCEGNYIYLVRERGVEMTYGQLPPRSRSKRLVESKRTVSVGAIIHGGPLPENPYKKFPLHNSFDAKGRLKKVAVTAEDQRKKCDFLSQETAMRTFEGVEDDVYDDDSQDKAESVPFVQFAPKVKRELTDAEIDRAITPIADTILMTALAEDAARIAAGVVQREERKKRIIERCADLLASNMIQEFAYLLAKYDGSNVLQQVKSEVAKQKAENKIEWISNFIGEHYVKAFVSKDTRTIGAQVHTSSMHTYIDDNSNVIAKVMLRGVVNESIDSACRTAYEDECRRRDQLVHQMRSKRNARLAKMCFLHWKAVYQKRKRFMHLKNTFPAGYIETTKPLMIHVDAKRKSTPLAKSQPSEDVKRIKIDSDNVSDKVSAMPIGPKNFMRQYARVVPAIRGYIERAGGKIDAITRLEETLRSEKEEGAAFSASLKVIEKSFNEMDYLEGKL